MEQHIVKRIVDGATLFTLLPVAVGCLKVMK